MPVMSRKKGSKSYTAPNPRKPVASVPKAKKPKKESR